MIRVGMIGSGAVVEKFHLPALVQLPGVQVTWLVDTQPTRLAKLAQSYSIPHTTVDYTAVTDVDAVLIATPHYLHATMCEFFLRQQVHVLCEKPLTIEATAAEQLVNLAAQKQLVLATGVFRRYFPVTALLRRMIEAEWLGPLVRIDAEEGGPYLWALQSRFVLQRDKSGGGVLIDTGSHTLDRILWWFGSPQPRLDWYKDNSATGVETDCELQFSISWRNQEIPVHVELSRTRQLRNTFQVVMAQGTIECPVNDPDRAWLLDHQLQNFDGCRVPFLIETATDGQGQPTALKKPYLTYFKEQFSNFLSAIETGQPPLNAASTVVPVVRLIESCYRSRQDLPEPWVSIGLDHALLPRQAEAVRL